jgi:hypothetical protein
MTSQATKLRRPYHSVKKAKCGGIYLPAQLWWQVESRRIAVQAGPGKTQYSILTITRAKSTRGVAQVIEHLLNKQKALSSSHSGGGETSKRGTCN